MPIQVLVERVAKNGFRATSGAPLALSVEAPTRAQALAKLKKQLQARLQKAELVPIEVIPEPHPWMEFAGMYDPDDPVIQDWMKSMAEYRRKLDEHPELP